MKTMQITSETKDVEGKDLAAARTNLARTAVRVGAAAGDRVATLCRIWFSSRRFSYGVMFHLPGDLATFTDEHCTRIEPVEQYRVA